MPSKGAAPVADYATFIDIRATPSVVFDYLVTAEGMTQWMGQHAALDPRPGGVFQVDIAGSPIRGEFVEVDPPRRVVVSWGVAGSEEFLPGTSTVSFTLTPTRQGTRVDLVHSGLPEARKAGHVYGWAHFLARLDAVSRGHAVGPDEWTPLPG
jgi:uncharacterized protein YndB with AHSA1/START domain